MATLVTFAVAVPVPLATVQVCAGPVGWVRTVTLYVLPLAIAVLKVNVPLAVIVRLSPALSCSTSPVPVSPVTVPPMEYPEEEDEEELLDEVTVPLQPNKINGTAAIHSNLVKTFIFVALLMVPVEVKVKLKVKLNINPYCDAFRPLKRTAAA
jgi:hypothetical protein